MSNLDQEIGKRLRKARKSRGYRSARIFAVEQQIPESTYSQHETGKRSLSPATVLRYCKYLDINPGWLLTGQEMLAVGPSENDGVPEAKLNASYRQVSNQQNKDTSTEIADNLVSINMDILRSVLEKAIHQYFAAESNKVNMDEFMAYCMRAYYNVAAVSPEFRVKETDSCASV